MICYSGANCANHNSKIRRCDACISRALKEAREAGRQEGKHEKDCWLREGKIVECPFNKIGNCSHVKEADAEGYKRGLAQVKFDKELDTRRIEQRILKAIPTSRACDCPCCETVKELNKR